MPLNLHGRNTTQYCGPAHLFPVFHSMTPLGSSKPLIGVSAFSATLLPGPPTLLCFYYFLGPMWDLSSLTRNGTSAHLPNPLPGTESTESQPLNGPGSPASLYFVSHSMFQLAT